MATQQHPRIKDIQELVKTSLVASTFFSDISSGIKYDNPGTTDKSVVVKENGLQNKTIERHLRDTGICVIVWPLLNGKARAQSGQTPLIDVLIGVELQINPTRNAESNAGGAGADEYEAIIAIIDAVCQTSRHPGQEFFQLAEEAFMLTQKDEGLLSYDIKFTKESIL